MCVTESLSVNLLKIHTSWATKKLVIADEQMKTVIFNIQLHTTKKQQRVS